MYMYNTINFSTPFKPSGPLRRKAGRDWVNARGGC